MFSSFWPTFLQDTVTATLANKEAKKKLSPTNAKALNTMRQRLKKHNLPYQEAMDKLRAQPDLPTESESEEEVASDSEDSESEQEEEPGKEASLSPSKLYFIR